ncbi:MAG: hypothetical protein Q8K99_13180 [Actinomycetota bacterium]|nr:hypothetical protein [Actinomycetota bacterium]
MQLVLAALLWTTAGLILGIRGMDWLLGNTLALPLFTAALILGELKARYLLDPVATKAVERILERGRGACAGGFLSWRSWLLVLTMMAGGHALRLTAIPHMWLGALYTTIATGLLLASRSFWRGAKMAVDSGTGE